MANNHIYMIINFPASVVNSLNVGTDAARGVDGWA